MRIIGIVVAILLVVLVTGVGYIWAFNPPAQAPPGGDGAIAVDASNNIGIGTASPAEKLQVVGGTRLGGFTAGDYINIIGTTKAVDVSLSNSGSGGQRIDFNLAGWSNDYFTFNSGATEIMRLVGNGNVGIGTSSPSAKLEVAGQIQITGGTPGLDKILTSNASGLATWETPPPTFNEAAQSNCAWTEWMSNDLGGLLTCPAGQVMAGLNTYENRVKSDDRRTWFTILCCGS